METENGKFELFELLNNVIFKNAKGIEDYEERCEYYEITMEYLANGTIPEKTKFKENTDKFRGSRLTALGFIKFALRNETYVKKTDYHVSEFEEEEIEKGKEKFLKAHEKICKKFNMTEPKKTSK